MSTKAAGVHRAGRTLLTLVVLACGTQTAMPADQTLSPRVEAGGAYDSNLRLVLQPLDDKVTGGYLDAQADWLVRTPLTRFSLRPRIRATRFSGNGESGTTNWFLSSDLNHRLASGQLDLAVNLSQQEVLNSELLNADGGNGLGTPGTGTTGLAFRNNRAFFADVSPAGRFALGPRADLQVNLQFVHVNYDQSLNLAQTDYSDSRAAVGLSFRSMPRMRVVAGVTADHYTPAAGNADANTYGANIQLWHEQSKLSRAFLRIGALRSQFGGQQNAPSKTSATGGVGVQHDFTRGQLLAQANRTIDGSGTGRLTLRNEVNLRLSRLVSERTTLSASAAGVWAEPVVASSGVNKRNYLVASLGARWRVRRTVSIVGRYAYSSIHFQGTSATPDSNSVYLGVAFEAARPD